MVSTRSGRKAEATTSDTQAAVDKPKRTSRRVAQKGVHGVIEEAPEQRPPPAVTEEDEDIIPAANAFKVISPVKVLTPRGGGLTAERTPAAQGSHKNLGSAQKVASPVPYSFPTPVDAKPTSPMQPPTRSLSVKDLVQEYSQIPLPGAAVEDDANEAEYAPKLSQRRRPARSSVPVWALVVGILTTTLLASTVTYTELCRGWPVAVSTPERLQPLCGQLNWNVAAAQQAVKQGASRAQQHVLATMAAAQSKAQHACDSAQHQWRTTVQHARLHFNAMQVTVHAKLVHLQHVATTSAAQLRSRIVSKKHTASEQAQGVPPTATSLPSHPAFEEVLPAEALRKLVQQQQGAYTDVADVYTHAVHQQHALHPKALGLLLACQADCTNLEHGLLQAAAQPDLLLRVDGSKYSAADSAGQLQQLLATFLLHNPSGVVVLRHLPAMQTSALAVLNNALSEGGSLQLRDKTISTSTALFVVLWDDAPLPTAVASHQFESDVKAQLHQAIAAKDDNGQLAGTLALALRRRLEYVLAEHAPAASPAAAAAPSVPAEAEDVAAEAAAPVEAAGASTGGSCWRVEALAEEAEAEEAAEAAAAAAAAA